jgi:hypothetical protein
VFQSEIENSKEVDDFTEDPYRPFNDLPEERHWVLTFRAVFIGVIAGALVNASNLYIGLKSGWTFTANLFGSIAGFGILNILSRCLPESYPILGGTFGPRENNIVQTTATAAGGMSSVFISAFPAMYKLNLLKSPQEDLWRIISLTAVAGYFGFFFATPRTLNPHVWLKTLTQYSAKVLYYLLSERAKTHLSYTFCHCVNH